MRFKPNIFLCRGRGLPTLAPCATETDKSPPSDLESFLLLTQIVFVGIFVAFSSTSASSYAPWTIVLSRPAFSQSSQPTNRLPEKATRLESSTKGGRGYGIFPLLAAMASLFRPSTPPEIRDEGGFRGVRFLGDALLTPLAFGLLAVIQPDDPPGRPVCVSAIHCACTYGLGIPRLRYPVCA